MSEIMTHSHKMFDPLHPDVTLIDIQDIAHALSMLCRANGHFKSFYSVCQHSINCAKEAEARGYSQRVQLACLLHDASEAYLSDITRPVKPLLKEYLKIEAALQNKIFDKWISPPLSDDERKQVFEIDDAMLYHELLDMMHLRMSDNEPAIFSHPDFAFTDFKQIEGTFLNSFEALKNQI